VVYCIYVQKAPSDKIIKYAKARASGKNKEQSKAIAGYSPNTLTTTIESSEAYKSISIKDTLLKAVTLDSLASRLADTALQGDDKNASTNAIKLIFDRVEPVNSLSSDDVEKVTVILSKD
jgi:hypothetical protein